MKRDNFTTSASENEIKKKIDKYREGQRQRKRERGRERLTNRENALDREREE